MTEHTVVVYRDGRPLTVSVAASTERRIRVQATQSRRITVTLPGPPGEPGTSIPVGPTPPANPDVFDLWIDTT